MEPAFSWRLLLPLLLSFFYGYTESRAKAVLKLPSWQAPQSRLVTGLSAAFITTAWSVLGFPLPIFFLLIYFLQAARLLTGGSLHMKNWFLLNLTYANLLALYFIFIGTAALIRNSAMRTLLSDPFWRTMSVSAVLTVLVLEDVCFLWRPDFSKRLSSEAESQEAGPFMAFLCFCAVHLLVDSMLCVFEPEPLYPPLFLMGSSVVVIFALIRFLLHIDMLIKNNHLKEEHDLLASKLQAAEASAGILKRLADRDALTGAFSRRYAMERMDALIAAKASFALVYLDLDALKQINDTQGHDAGDSYLVWFVSALGARLRNGDLLARVGGDEFVILMPGCAVDTAVERIQEIRDALERECKGDTAFRFSYGVAEPHGSQPNAELLLREADLAMYRDKEQRHLKKGR